MKYIIGKLNSQFISIPVSSVLACRQSPENKGLSVTVANGTVFDLRETYLSIDGLLDPMATHAKLVEVEKAAAELLTKIGDK